MAFLVPLLAGIGVGTGVSTVGTPFLDAAAQEIYKQFPSKKPNPNELIQMRYRNQLTQASFLELMSRNGFDENFSNQLLATQRPLLGITENINLLRRGLLGKTKEDNEQAFFSNMEKLGIAPDIAVKFVTANQVIETPNQIVTFMVREVFSPEVTEKFGQFQEFPELAVEEFAKIGIGKDLALRIWAAHWELPAVQQVSQAMHRFAPDIIDDAKEDLDFLGVTKENAKTDLDTVRLLLKTQDVMPFWRDKILATQFNPLNRVDVRRMIRLRLLNYREANYANRSLGFTPRNARRLTKFGFVNESLSAWKDGLKQGSLTMEDILGEAREWQIAPNIGKKDEQEENIQIIAAIERELAPELAEGVSEFRNLALTKILKAFREGIIDRNKSIELIGELNYSDEQVKFILEVEDARIEEEKERDAKRQGLTKTDILKSFREGVRTESAAIDGLVEIGKSPDAAKELIDIEKIKLQKKASKT